jgi:hypothetical protein
MLLVVLAIIAFAGYAALGGSAVAATYDPDHPFSRHGDDASAVLNCLSSRGASAQLHNDWTNRNALVCQLDDGRFGVVIVDEQGRTWTAFIKNKMRSIDQVMKYLSNAGYH